jgi:thioredoxin-like negative regulator of GroEL
MLAVNPLVPLPYRHLAKAAEYLGDDGTAITAYRKLIVLEPADPAAVHFSLAKLLHKTGDAEAKRHVLIALEEAPRYREAHRLLLQMVEQEKPAQQPGPREPEADAPAPPPEKEATPDVNEPTPTPGASP